jgi:hypothetical protein
MDNADAPIRYRVARELLHDEAVAKKTEGMLFDLPVVAQWLKNLEPDMPRRRADYIEHGSFDSRLENAVLKAVQLGLHAGLPQVAAAVGYFVNKVKHAPNGPYRNKYKGIYGFYESFIHIITCNLLVLIQCTDNAVLDNALGSLEELYAFTSKGQYDIYLSNEEKAKLKGIPTIWKDKPFIRRSLFAAYGVFWPMIYDIVGLSVLYDQKNSEVDRKINQVISYLSTDVFHCTVADGYGIVESSEKKYHAVGWDPKYPGWLDVKGYMESDNAPKLLFFALYMSKYPSARKTGWFGDLLAYMDSYKTNNGTYLFPAHWLKEKQGYAVQGNHISFGENRKKKNWREIESTFYIQLLHRNI